MLRELQQREGQSEQLRQASKERARKAMTLEQAFMQIRQVRLVCLDRRGCFGSWAYLLRRLVVVVRYKRLTGTILLGFHTQATGVTTLDEMVAKFMGQGANKTALEDEKAEAERRLARIKEQKREAEDQFAELKVRTRFIVLLLLTSRPAVLLAVLLAFLFAFLLAFLLGRFRACCCVPMPLAKGDNVRCLVVRVQASDLGGTELSRERIANYESEITAARAQLKVSKAACERLEGVLVAVRQGAAGLAQRLAPFDFLDDGPAKPGADDDSSESNDSNTKVTERHGCCVVVARDCCRHIILLLTSPPATFHCPPALA